MFNIKIPYSNLVLGGRLSGKAFHGTVCGESNIAIVTNTGGFEGVKAISHEVAHL